MSEPRDDVVSERAPEPVGPFPHAKRAGQLLFLSGIGPRVRGSKEIPGVTFDDAGGIAAHDITEQCHAVFRNVRTVLEDSGSDWERIVDVTVFLTDMKRRLRDVQPDLRRVLPRQPPGEDDRRGQPAADSDRHRAEGRRDDRPTNQGSFAQDSPHRAGVEADEAQREAISS